MNKVENKDTTEEIIYEKTKKLFDHINKSQ